MRLRRRQGSTLDMTAALTAPILNYGPRTRGAMLRKAAEDIIERGEEPVAGFRDVFLPEGNTRADRKRRKEEFAKLGLGPDATEEHRTIAAGLLIQGEDVNEVAQAMKDIQAQDADKAEEEAERAALETEEEIREARRFELETGADRILERMAEGPAKDLTRSMLDQLDVISEEIALGCALLVMATVSGNNFIAKAPGRATGLNPFIITLAPSGRAKSSAEAAIGTGLNQAGVHKRLVSKIPSAEGLHARLHSLTKDPGCPTDGRWKSPTLLRSADEYGDFVAGSTKGKSGRMKSQEDGVIDMENMLYSRATGPMARLEDEVKANSVREGVSNPFYVKTGYTTFSAYLPAMTEPLLNSGYGNRHLHVIATEDNVAKDRGEGVIPEAVVAVLDVVRTGCHAPVGVERAEGVVWRPERTEDWHRVHRCVVMTKEQNDRFTAATEAARAEMSRLGHNEIFGGRVGENAIKVAALLTMMDMAADALMFEQPNGQPGWNDVSHDMREEHIEFAIWFVMRQTVQFARLVGGGVDDEVSTAGMVLLDKFRRHVSDPVAAVGNDKKCLTAIPDLRKGKIPHFIVAREFLRGQPTLRDRAVAWLEAAEYIECVREPKKVAEGEEQHQPDDSDKTDDKNVATFYKLRAR